MTASRKMLRHARRDNERSGIEGAERLGVGIATVYRLEKGWGVQGRVLLRIPRAYGLTKEQAQAWYWLACAEEHQARGTYEEVTCG